MDVVRRRWGDVGGDLRSPSPRQQTGRLMRALDDEDRTDLDLWADDEADQQAQVERSISLGAQRVDWEYPDDADFVVLADPDGNSFCVIA